MLKSKKFIITMLCALVIFVSAMAMMGFSTFSVYAATNYNSVEMYTDSDKLLKEDGTLSNRTINDFCNDVKKAALYADCSEITQVIPKQFLESEEINDSFYYNGNEYGFYVAKEGEYFDVLLIDFIYEFDSGVHNNDYKIKIKPILQQSFLRSTGSDGDYIWKKYSEGRYIYYVANPRFLTILRNENDLNYGDINYSKQDDEGLIISQTRVNYGKISYKTEDDLLEATGEFLANQILDVCIDAIDPSGVLGIIKDSIEFGAGLYNEGKEVTVLADNEKNIFTEQSKTDQRENANISGYSRIAGFAPKEEIILSAADDSYAEFITLLNDTNYRSRINQICEFDIVRRQGLYSSMQYVAGNWNDENAVSLSFSKERILFDNYSSKEIPSGDFQDKTTSLYLLPYGDQKVIFKPQYTGEYEFLVSDNLAFSVSGFGSINQVNGRYCVYLDAGSTYIITIKNTTNSIYSHASLNCQLREYDGTAVFVKGNNSYLGSYTVTGDIFCKLTAGTTACRIKILDRNLTVLKQSDTNSCYYNFKANEQYYVQIINTSGTSINVVVSNSQPQSVNVGSSYSKTISGEEYYSVPLTANNQYVLEYSSPSSITYLGCLEQVVISELSDSSKKINYAILETGTNQSIRFGFKGTGTITISVKTVQSAYKWEVNDKTYSNFNASEDARLISSNKLVIRRGTEAKVRLKLGSGYIDDVVQKSNTYNGYSYSNYTLKINSDCQLTNDDGTNILGLLVAINRFEIANLQIQVINDISTTEISRYSDNNGYGFQFGKISNVSNDGISIEYKTSLSSRIYTDTISNNQKLDISSKVSTTYYNSFEVTIRKIYITSTGGKTTIYGGSLNHSSLTNTSLYFNKYFDYGDGTSTSPYILSCYRHLNNIRGIATSNKNFKLSCNIDAGYIYDSYWTPIQSFKGTFDGNGYAITNFHFNDIITNENENMGLFGENQESSTIKNLIVGYFYINHYYEEQSMPTSIINIGAIAGTNKGNIENCTAGYLHHYAEVSVRIYWKTNLGTICGTNEGTFSGCNVMYSSLDIASGSVGGVVGYNSGTVKGCNVQHTTISCYNLFPDYQSELYPSGHYGRAGGVVGENTGTIQLCSVTYNVQLICAGGYYSAEKEDNYSYSPEIGIICGYSNKAPTGCTMNSDVVVDDSYLHVETWNGGFLWLTKYSHDQAQYVGARAVGHLV